MASIPKGSSSADRAGWSFARLLDWHLNRGRPTGDLKKPGKQWTSQAFADALGGYSERSVRNWRAGRNIPPDIESIERELFGSNAAYDAWRTELRDAHRRAKGSEGPDA